MSGATRDASRTWVSKDGRDASTSKEGNPRDANGGDDRGKPDREPPTEAVTTRMLAEEPENSLSNTTASTAPSSVMSEEAIEAKRLKEKLRSRKRRLEQSEAARERERLRSQKRRDALTPEERLEIARKKALARLQRRAMQRQEGPTAPSGPGEGTLAASNKFSVKK